jgi:hypothetical protein
MGKVGLSANPLHPTPVLGIKPADLHLCPFFFFKWGLAMQLTLALNLPPSSKCWEERFLISDNAAKEIEPLSLEDRGACSDKHHKKKSPVLRLGQSSWDPDSMTASSMTTGTPFNFPDRCCLFVKYRQ